MTVSACEELAYTYRTKYIHWIMQIYDFFCFGPCMNKITGEVSSPNIKYDMKYDLGILYGNVLLMTHFKTRSSLIRCEIKKLWDRTWDNQTITLYVCSLLLIYDDVFKWKHFPRYWPLKRSPVNSPHKGQWRGALMFSLICAWINGWVNNREAGDLRRHRAQFNVIVMNITGFLRHVYPYMVGGCIYEIMRRIHGGDGAKNILFSGQVNSFQAGQWWRICGSVNWVVSWFG